MLGSIGLICVLSLSLLSLASNGFFILFQSLHSFPSNGLFEKSLILQFSESKMASSQVEIASSAPFGCVLRDHNRQERCSREINARTAFQKNLKHLVRDHLQSCISSSAPDENSQNADDWVSHHHHHHHNNNNNNNHRDKREELLSAESRWARAREMVTAIDRNSGEQRENSPTQSDSSAEIPNLGGVSSLVQRWRDLAEAALNQNANRNNLNASSSPVCITGRTNSGSIYHPENASFVELPPAPPSETRDSVDERFDTPSVMTEDSFMDWESDRTAPSGPPSAPGRDSDGGGESERVRVADVIRKLTLTAENPIMNWKNDHDCEQHSFGNESLPRLRTLSVMDHHQQEQRCLSPAAINSPCIRGRQAFSDLLMQLERDRQKELDGLEERRAVSRFKHKGRIQALLRLRFLRREADVGYQQHSCSVPVDAQQRSRREAAVRDQQLSQSMALADGVRQHLIRVAAIGAQQLSHSRVVGAQVQQHSCHEEVVRDQQHSHCETAVEAPQHSHSEATVGPQQHLHSTTTTNRLQQHSNSAEVGVAQQPLCREETIGNQQHLYPEAVGVQQNSPALKDRQNSHSMASESCQPRQGSTVVLLREKFDVRVEHDAANLKTSREVVVNNIPDVKISSTSNQLREEPHHQEGNTTEQQSTLSAQNSVSYATEDVNEETSPNSDSIWQGTSSNGLEENVNAEDQDANNPELTSINEDRISDWEEQESRNQQLMGTDQDWISDVSRPWSEWDEQEDNNQQITNHDWIGDVSRPRSDWEGLRQARYQEMLDPYLENEDIRQLLQRRSVSTFLSSNLRETMDQLLISRVERLPHSMGNQQEEEQGFHNRLEQLMMSHIQRQTNTMNNQQEDDEEEEEEQVDREEESPIGHQYSEVGDYVDQAVAGVRSWSHDSDHEVSDDSDQAVSPSLQQPRSSQSFSPEARPCSSFTHRSSIEMELMYDLRGHMEQLHHEMSELRKSIKSCMNMQAKMQRSIKEEVAAAVSSSVRRGMGKKSLKGAPKKGGCCVCLEMEVDALLYRCGHMCTCFKCAHELQWSSGKCPICRAPIVDVVRAYANNDS